MTNRKRPVEIWPFDRVEDEYGAISVRFPMPDGVCMLARCDTPEELRAAQFKARATARAIVRAEHPQAFAGLKA